MLTLIKFAEKALQTGAFSGLFCQFCSAIGANSLAPYR